MAEDQSHVRTGRWLEFLRILPQFLWVFLAAYIATWIIIPTVEAVRRGQGVEVKMSEFTLKVVERRLESARQQGPVVLGRSDFATAFSPLSDRIARSRRQLGGATILWVDDNNPIQNAFERRAIGALGVSIDTANSTEDAIALLDQGLAYDAVITDLNRPNQQSALCQAGSTRPPQAGCELIARLARRCGETMPPTIVYTGKLERGDPIPASAFGITNRPVQLMMLLLDAFERRPEAQANGDASPPSDPAVVCQGNPLSPEASPAAEEKSVQSLPVRPLGSAAVGAAS